MVKQFQLIEIDKYDKQHLEATYHILSKREFHISHKSLPTFSQHINFVKNHPYRVWYLIKDANSFLGTSYLGEDNSVGITLLSGLQSDYEIVINTMLTMHKPFHPIQSLRSSYFHFNIHPKNTSLINAVKALGFSHIQNTYA